jgi:ATP:ADP antiporter, AAA family
MQNARTYPGVWRQRCHGAFARAVDLRAGEGVPLLLGFAMFFCLLAGYTLLRPLRDAMGIAGGADALPWLFSATFVAMLALVPVFGAMSARLPPRRFVPLVYRVFAVNLFVFAALVALDVRAEAVGNVFFVWVSVYNLFVVSIFWSVLADSFSSDQGKRLFGFIAAGGTAGTLVGPALAALLAPLIGAAGLALLAAALLEAALRCYRGLIRRIGGGLHPAADRAVGGGMVAGLTLIARSPYLAAIVAYMLLHTTTATLVYFEQARIVGAAFADTASRARFFAVVDLAVSILTLALQMLVAGRAIRKIGLGALALLPLAALGAFAALACDPRPLVLGAAQVVRRSADYALSRPAREVLYTVVSREAKYKAKSVIETLVYRGGDAASGWLAAGIAAAGASFAGVAALAALPILGWTLISFWLGRRQADRAASEPGSIG